MNQQTPIRLRVVKYIPNRMFGFLSPDGGTTQYFFHLRVFHPGVLTTCMVGCLRCQHQPCEWLKHPPPPIMGEVVDAVIESDPDHPNQLRAARVTRVEVPVPVLGTVDSFDSVRGYGFIKGDDNRTYYLHRSEVVEGRIPAARQNVTFFTAERREKARACHVNLCPEG